MREQRQLTPETAPPKEYSPIDASLLIEAIQSKNTELLSRALSNNANPDLFDGMLIRMAAKRGDYEATDILLKAGADGAILDNFPLKHAAEGGHLNVSNLLLKSGASFDSFDASNPIHSNVAPLYRAWLLKTKIDKQVVPKGIMTFKSL